MAGARSRRRHESLGDSWGTADYSDDNISIDSADSLSDVDGRSAYFEEQGRGTLQDDDEDDMATPMPHPRTTRASQNMQDTPTKTFTTQRPQMPRQGSRSFQQPTPQQSPEPSFIMPSMHSSVNDFGQPSPLRNSQPRSRKSRQSSSQSQTGRMSRFPPPSDRRASSGPRRRQPQEEPSPGHYLELFWTEVLQKLLLYILDVVKHAMNLAKPLFSLGLILAFIALLLSYFHIYARNTFQAAVAPVCALPLSSYVFSFCGVLPEGHQADFEQLVKVQSSFEEILDANKDSYYLPASMKKSQVAMRDLRSQIKFSQLPSRSEMEVELDSFIELARDVSDDLAKYNARVGYVTDQVISTNKWTLQVLAGLAAEQPPGAMHRTIAMMNPLAALFPPRETLEQRIFAQYVGHVSKVKDDITGLIHFSESLILLLNTLDNRLDIIADIAVRDDVHITRDHAELLAQLWSRLGGNRTSRAANTASLQLLREVMRYRSLAVQHVSATLLKLREISAGLENLRDGVAAPEIVGYRPDVPLQYHIELVSLSVERLRDARGEMMAVEREAIRKGMGETVSETGVPGVEGPTVYAKKTTA